MAESATYLVDEVWCIVDAIEASPEDEHRYRVPIRFMDVWNTVNAVDCPLD